jgi:CheY-like chemotaxis protein
MRPKVLIGITDLVLSSKILVDAAKSDTEVDIEKSHTGVLALADEMQPDVIIIDLDAKALKPLEIARELRMNERGNKARLIGCLSYIRRDLQQKALESGYDMVLTRSQFTEHLPEILKGDFDFLEAVNGRSG